MERTGAIYVLTNTVNGKAYVGQTWATPEKRFEQHVKQANRPKHPIAHAIRKHGAGSFTLRVHIDGVRDQALLDLLEMDCIRTFGTSLDVGGYNATAGGQGKGICISAETRQKIAAAMTGKKRPGLKNRRAKGEYRHTPESKAKISVAMAGKSRPKRSAEHAAKLKAEVSSFWSDPEKAKSRREAIARFWASPESQARREAASRFWSNPENVKARNEKRLARKAGLHLSLLN